MVIRDTRIVGSRLEVGDSMNRGSAAPGFVLMVTQGGGGRGRALACEGKVDAEKDECRKF